MVMKTLVRVISDNLSDQVSSVLCTRTSKAVRAKADSSTSIRSPGSLMGATVWEELTTIIKYQMTEGRSLVANTADYDYR